MDAVEGQGPTTQSSSSSTGEPVAVRRRLDMDGSFTGSVEQRHGQQSLAPQAADAANKDDDEVLDSAGVSSSTGDSNSVLAGDSDADNRRRTAAPGNASGVVGDGQHQRGVVVSETSESCKRSGSGNTTEKETGVTSGKDDSDPDEECGTVLHNISCPFGGSANSLAELDQDYERASEALKQEMEREDKVLSVICENVSSVSQLIWRFQGIANVHLGEIVTRIENRDLRGSNVCSRGFEKKVDAIKAYVSEVCAAAPSEEGPESPGHWDFTVTDTTKEAERSTSDEERRNRRAYVRHRYAVRRASNSVRKSQNVVIRQRKVMSKLAAVAGQLVSKAKVSCRLILDCLKTVVTVLTPAVGACLLLDALVRALERDGQSLPALKIAASVASRWTREALLHGERAVRLHKDAIAALSSAHSELVFLGTYEVECFAAFTDIMSAGNSFLGLTRQTDVSLAQIWDQVSQIKSMRGRLTSDIKEMRKLRNLVEKWSAVCSDKLSVILQTLTSATQSSCNAIEEATKTVVFIIIPDSVSLKQKPIHDFMELFK